MSKLLILLFFALLQYSNSAYCSGKPKQYYVNEQPIWTSWEDQPKFLKKHSYGKLFEIGTNTTAMKMIHVYGNMYQMGLAQGQLLKTQLGLFIKQLWGYIQTQVIDGMPKSIPKFIVNAGANIAIADVLDLNYFITLPYTNKKYYQEMRGIADGSGVDFKFLRRIHMIGQLTKGHCSMFGAWGKATSNGQTIQLRSLDWDFNGPYIKYPVVVVYHPSSPKYGYSWVNIGFMGWIGVLSGVNEHKIAVSEIGVSYPDKETFGKQSRFGNPFTFVLRDVLQFDKTLDQSIKRMKKTKRTCNLILGVGDGNQKGQFRSFQYSHTVLNVIDDKNPLPKNDTWHPAIENTVYHGMDWLCPPFYERLGEMLTKYHGNITAENAMKYIVPSSNSGDVQAVVYDLTYEKVYFAFGYKDLQGHATKAFNRPFIGLDLKAMFGEKNI